MQLHTDDTYTRVCGYNNIPLYLHIFHKLFCFKLFLVCSKIRTQELKA